MKTADRKKTVHRIRHIIHGVSIERRECFDIVKTGASDFDVAEMGATASFLLYYQPDGICLLKLTDIFRSKQSSGKCIDIKTWSWEGLGLFPYENIYLTVAGKHIDLRERRPA